MFIFLLHRLCGLFAPLIDLCRSLIFCNVQSRNNLLLTFCGGRQLFPVLKGMIKLPD
jgi:hypothetical protein